MKTNLPLPLTLAAIGLIVGTTAASAAASVADFYKGKKIAVVIGYTAGGGYDLYSRAMARHMGKHIPGNPVLVPQNMEGAGSRVAANWLYNVAPKDGTAIGMVGENTPLDQALRAEGIQFDAAKFNWIGNAIADNNVTYVSATTGLASMDDVLKKGGLICGGTGASSPSILQPTILNNLLNANIKIITGYPGGNDVNLAIERGEVNCRGSNSWSSTKATLSRLLEAKALNMLVQFGVNKNPEIGQYQGRDVPLVAELAKSDEDRAALGLLTSGSGLGRSFLAPPGLPADRVAALRAAFQATMADKDFLEEAKKAKMDINVLSGEAVQKVAADTVAATPKIVARSKELVTLKGVEELKK